MVTVTEILRYSAFAATPDGGNPAGVVLDASALDERRMQEIAAEVGYAETAFIVDSAGAEQGRYRVRYFSPAAEVPFCGHATVATAVALTERKGTGTFTFATAAGEVVMTSTQTDGDVTIAFTSVPPQVRELDASALAAALELLGVVPGDLEPDLPVREAFAGNWHPIIALADRELFHQFRFAPAPLAALMLERGWTGTVTVLHRIAPDEFLARNLFPVGRINEDPATGSAAAATGAYLREVLGFGGDRTVRIHQGHHVGRPSLLTVTVPDAGGIVVSGGAVPIRL
ncbi:PhzF family phenazine biosynthesis protein [Mycobacterium sp. CBMA293]|nr:PhzF family phenazine biosynthesis protein [Mycolicibacterium sp. CBMA 360]MUL58454.1 PhzF family phenazine biosynthesis protein [Mycolicibacterium sp. CBMA 335]MUL73912.1 PhzF family phenazine biosynthesis protein [Mycolicibacterium sp. CBMA 311]MUL93337.1 PhzF family phenazine biosynthesis protein [Mycolicibacterium sp. CBMA 230]MUM07884.1 phenazine biosynthesis protein PhzF [Mycolicibacterium sp. CBMA 213]MUM10180.1 PhzF family phenazine biosynthesis protein [Mycolicibacterium sp. CBMA 2